MLLMVSGMAAASRLLTGELFFLFCFAVPRFCGNALGAEPRYLKIAFPERMP